MKKNIKQKKGTFYGIGVGPGDPELLTIKAQKLLEKIKYIFTATSGRNRESLALKIASVHLRRDAIISPLNFPMTRDRQTLKEAWIKNAQKVLKLLNEGKDAIFLTLGDPSTYSTFTYLHRNLCLLEKDVNIKVVPGITSFQAASAALKLPLAEAEESLSIISGAKGANELKKALTYGDNIVILKAYKKYNELISCLKKERLLNKCVGIRHVGLKEESIAWDVTKWDGDKPSYFTLLLLKKENLKKRLND